VAGRVSFELLFETFPGLVAPTRRFVQETIQPVVRDPDDVARIAMAAHELLENAVQYGTGRVTKLGVSISTTDRRGSMEVALRLTNETSPSHIERLRQGVAALLEPSKALEHYRHLMMRKWDSDQESSGMGLARIVVESELKLAVEVSGASVTLLASGRVGEANV
jgi:two-component sensor histidine kinase